MFGDELAAIGARRPDVVAITAAMLHPTGLAAFARAFPDRVFDVGIAEQHAMTSAAGLAMGGLHPVVAIYATFLNRAFDQLLMDVALHRLPVTVVLDRAGVTGPDGASHNGMWDGSILQVVPGPADRRAAGRRPGSAELLSEAVAVTDGPTVVRFPKGTVGAEVEAVGSARRRWTCCASRPTRPPATCCWSGRARWPGCAWRPPAGSPTRASASPWWTRAGSSRWTRRWPGRPRRTGWW